MHRVTQSQRVTLHAFQGAVWYNRNLFWSLNFLLIHHKRFTRMGMLTYIKDDVLRYSLPFHRCQMLIEFISRMLFFFNILPMEMQVQYFYVTYLRDIRVIT